MGVRNDCSVGDKFARIVAAVEAVAAGEADKEPRKPVRVGVADEKQALGTQFVEEIGEAYGHGLFVEFPDEFERLLVDERAVRDPGDPAEKMKDDAVWRAGIVARDVYEGGIRRVSEDMIGGRAERIGEERIDRGAEEEPQRLDGAELAEWFGHGKMTFGVADLVEDLLRLQVDVIAGVLAGWH